MVFENPFIGIDGVDLDGLEFCSRVYTLFKLQNTQPLAVIEKLSLRQGISEKKLLEELLPIAHYIQTNYRPGRYISVQWINGAQKFDAHFKQSGEYVNHFKLPVHGFFEVTCAMQENEKGHVYVPDRSQIARKNKLAYLEGMSEPHSFKTKNNEDDGIELMAPFILKSITKKINKHYQKDTILIVSCTLNSQYSASAWKSLVQIVQSKVSQNSFNEMWLLDDDHQFIDRLI